MIVRTIVSILFAVMIACCVAVTVLLVIYPNIAIAICVAVTLMLTVATFFPFRMIMEDW